ncbi:MAG: M20/M25/M40 family metallo-hydrolase [Chlamydiales bacterium]
MVEKIDFQRIYKEHEKEILDDYSTFLRFETIASDSKYKDALDQCSLWLKKYLEKIGLTAVIWKTKGSPIVFAEYIGTSSPSILIYHHYDVQPVEPLNAWKTPPFDPTCINGKMFARGASDNKGQCMCSLAALQIYMKSNQSKKGTIKILIEGEEEIGSSSLLQLLKEKKKELYADYMLIYDVGLSNATTPAVTFGMRGILGMEATLQTVQQDLHSGVYGNIALNPNRAMANIMHSLWNPDGFISIPGFYKDIQFPTEKELKQLTFPNTKESLKKLGVTSFVKNSIRLKEENWLLPSIEITSWFGGYTTEGIKTIIPNKTTIKLSCRLALGQRPNRVMKQLKNFLLSQTPKGATWKIKPTHGYPAYRAPLQSKLGSFVRDIYTQVFSKKCINLLSGATIPIVSELSKVCREDLLLIGVALLSDSIHAPNEHFQIKQLERGVCIIGKIFESFHNLE